MFNKTVNDSPRDKTPRDYQAWRDARFQGVSVDDLIAQMREVEAHQQDTALPHPDEHRSND